jgi:serine protease Do
MPSGQAIVTSALRSDLEEVAARLRRSTFVVRARGGHGSGLAVGGDRVVTNAHVAGRGPVEVELASGKAVVSEVLATAPERDLALIRVPVLDAPAPPFRDSRTLRAGEIVFASGNPLGIVGALSAGIVHSVDPRGRRVIADVRIAPGNSGGPLADAFGAIVGLNAMLIDGLAVGIASSAVTRFLEAPGSRRFIGVVVEPVSASIEGRRRPGLLIVDVADGGPAQRAGITIGDVVLAIDRRPLEGPGDLGDAVDGARGGVAILLEVARDGAVLPVPVIVGDRARERPRAA